MKEKEKDQLKSNVTKFKMQLPCVIEDYVTGYDIPLAKKYVNTIKMLINDIGIKNDILFLDIKNDGVPTINIEFALPKRSQIVFERLIKEKHNALRDIILNINDNDGEFTSNDIKDWLDEDGKYYIYTNPIQLRYMLEYLTEVILEEDNVNDKYYGSIEKYLDVNL